MPLNEIIRAGFLALAMAAFAILLFRAERRNYGAIASVAAILVGAAFGFIACLSLVLWTKIDDGYFFSDACNQIASGLDEGVNLGLLGSIMGILISWVSLKLFGKRRALTDKNTQPQRSAT